MAGPEDKEVTALDAEVGETAVEGGAADDSLQARLDPSAGPTRVGRYVLLRELGRGAIGVVYAAYHEGLGRKLAIKVLNRQRAGRADLEARLRREARALAKLSHPNVVQVYDVGEVEGRVFVAMEFVDGEPLSDWMRRSHELDAIISMFVAAGRGLAAAHEAGVIHRDFKPDNVLVGRDGRPRVLDFGLARALEHPVEDGIIEALTQARDGRPLGRGRAPEPEHLDHDGDAELTRVEPDLAATSAGSPDEIEPTLLSAPGSFGDASDDGADRDRDDGQPLLTKTGAMMGTPAYMSPEQFLGHRVDQASDQFGFCIAFYEALHGHRPFAGKTAMELAVATREGRLVPVSASARVPPWLQALLVRGLDPDPNARFASMDALLDELERDRERPRRRWGLAVSLAALLGATALVLALGRPADSPCPGVEATAAQLWTPTRAQELEAALGSAPPPYASAAWREVEPRLRGFAERWAAERVEACEATRVRHDFSSEVLELRQACLDHHRLRYDALVKRLSQVSREGRAPVVEHAVEAVAALPDPGRCGDVDALLSALPRPTTDDTAAVEAVRVSLIEAETLAETGAWDEGLDLGRAALDRARATGYAPVVAEALLTVGLVRARAGRVEAAQTDLQAALEEAERSGHDALVPRVAIELVWLCAGPRPDPVRGEVWARRARASLEGGGEDPQLEIRASWARGRLARVGGSAQDQDQGTQAETELRRALELLDAWAPDHPSRTLLLQDLGLALEQRGATALARDTYARALGESRSRFGASHPRVGQAHYSLARLEFGARQFDAARDQLALARDIFVAARGPLHRDVGQVELLEARIALAAGRLDDAEREAKTAESIYAAALGDNEADDGADNEADDGADDELERAEPVLVLAAIALARGDYETAIARYEAGLAIEFAAAPTRPVALASTRTALGLTYLAQGQAEPAVVELEQALALVEADALVEPATLETNRRHLHDALLARAGPGDAERAAALLEFD